MRRGSGTIVAAQLGKLDLLEGNLLLMKHSGECDLVIDDNGQLWIIVGGVPVWRGQDFKTDEVVRKWSTIDDSGKVDKKWLEKTIANKAKLKGYKIKKSLKARELEIAQRVAERWIGERIISSRPSRHGG